MHPSERTANAEPSLTSQNGTAMSPPKTHTQIYPPSAVFVVRPNASSFPFLSHRFSPLISPARQLPREAGRGVREREPKALKREREEKRESHRRQRKLFQRATSTLPALPSRFPLQRFLQAGLPEPDDIGAGVVRMKLSWAAVTESRGVATVFGPTPKCQAMSRTPMPMK